MATVNKTYTGVVTSFAGPPQDSGRGYGATSFIKVNVDGQEVYVRSKPGDDDYYFLRSVAKDQKVDVIHLKGGGGGTYWKIVPPDNWEPDPALKQKIQLEVEGGEPAQQQASVPEQTYHPIDESGNVVDNEPKKEKPAHTWQPRRLVDKLHDDLVLDDEADRLERAIRRTKAMSIRLGLEGVTDDQVYASGTALYITLSRARLPVFDPKTVGLRTPFAPDKLKSILDKAYNARYGDKNGKVATSANLFKAFIATMSEHFRSDDERHAALRFLFDVDSSKDLVEGQMRAFLDWAGDKPPSPVVLLEIEELRKVL